MPFKQAQTHASRPEVTIDAFIGGSVGPRVHRACTTLTFPGKSPSGEAAFDASGSIANKKRLTNCGKHLLEGSEKSKNPNLRGCPPSSAIACSSFALLTGTFNGPEQVCFLPPWNRFHLSGTSIKKEREGPKSRRTQVCSTQLSVCSPIRTVGRLAPPTPFRGSQDSKAAGGVTKQVSHHS